MNRRIKFPTVHIAESVLSRILDTADSLGLGPGIPHQGASTRKAQPTGSRAAEPDPTDPELAGELIDAKVHTPPPEDVPPLEPQAPPDDVLAGILARGDNIISA